MVTRDTTDNETISKVGILASDTSAEFEPIKLAVVNETCIECLRKEFHNEHDYPVSMLASANILYDSFTEKEMPKHLKYNTLILLFGPKPTR